MANDTNTPSTTNTMTVIMRRAVLTAKLLETAKQCGDKERCAMLKERLKGLRDDAEALFVQAFA